ncbi:copper resistance CopC family protein [Rhizomonospora bruguierae]|uniref:copper resistance CopC family protein n=1 Tax=Rhizomonospora bruguierae TaxID=1581705 RepID=UPI001BCC2F49|nr:copper resistance CopC family protein [Micromonospora sp. NBRC 107566]
MRPAGFSPPRRTASRLALLAVLVCAGLAATPGAGYAAERLTAARPADGAALATAPTEVVLTFSRAPDRQLSHISVRDSAGQEVGSGEPARSGADGLRVEVSIRSPGDYTVAYHVVLDNGSDVTGALRFSSGTGIPPAPMGKAESARVTAGGHAHGVDPIGATLLLVDLAVVVFVGVLLLRRRPG